MKLPRGKPTEDYLEVIQSVKEELEINIKSIDLSLLIRTNAIDVVRYKEEVKQLKIQLAEIKRIASRPIQLKE